MGYTRSYIGEVKIDPALSEEEIEFLNKLRKTRRMKREKGPYYVDGSGFCGQDHESDILDYNAPPEGQPGLWCHWQISEDGTSLFWDNMEKFYYDCEWLSYIIEHFLCDSPLAQNELPFLRGGYSLNGSIFASGERVDDVRFINVINNEVFDVKAEMVGVGELIKVDENSLRERDEYGLVEIEGVEMFSTELTLFDPEKEVRTREEFSMAVPESMRSFVSPKVIDFDIFTSEGGKVSIEPCDFYNMKEFYFVVLNVLFNKNSKWYNKDLALEAYKNVIIDGEINIRGDYDHPVPDSCYLLRVLENELFFERACYKNPMNYSP